ncbi:MAG TPA: DUF368 domain-containing protein [Clostridiales bacterium]|nr:DUF368 domain-containing protein [Clostridiales bacterium]
MDFIIKFIQGMIIGVGSIMPGVSGGTMAVVFGLFEKIMDAIATGFRDLKNKIIFFAPLGLGACVGVVLFSKLVKYLFEYHSFQTKYAFIGLMIGTLPSVVKDCNKKGFKPHYLIPCAITLATTIAFIFLDKGVSEGAALQSTPLLYILYGAILGFGTIIPGISASFILIYLGAYQTMIGAISDITNLTNLANNLRILIPAGIGFVLSIVLFAKLISFLFKKAYGVTYYAVLGFVIGSIFMIFPGIRLDLTGLLGLVLLLAGFFASLYLSRFSKD